MTNLKHLKKEEEKSRILYATETVYRTTLLSVGRADTSLRLVINKK